MLWAYRRYWPKLTWASAPPCGQLWARGRSLDSWLPMPATAIFPGKPTGHLSYRRTLVERMESAENLRVTSHNFDCISCAPLPWCPFSKDPIALQSACNRLAEHSCLHDIFAISDCRRTTCHPSYIILRPRCMNASSCDINLLSCIMNFGKLLCEVIHWLT